MGMCVSTASDFSDVSDDSGRRMVNAFVHTLYNFSPLLSFLLSLSFFLFVDLPLLLSFSVCVSYSFLRGLFIL
jgi:hypothetical protein